MADLFGLGSVVSAGGGLLDGLFGKSTPKPVKYSGDLGREIDRFSRGLPADDATYASALQDYATANRDRIGNTKRLAGLAEADFSGLLGSAKGYDSVLTHNRLLDSQVGALKDIMGFAGDAGRREDNLRLAAMGLGGRPSGSYERALVADRTARAFAPQFGNIISNLNGVYSTAEGSRSQNLADLINLINMRTGTAEYGAGLELNPALATLQIRGGQIGNLGGLAEAAKANTAGYSAEQNWASRLGGALQTAGNGMIGASGAGGLLGGGFNLGGQIGGMNIGLNYGGGRVPMNWTSLTPAEQAMYSGYNLNARQNVPYGSRWE